MRAAASRVEKILIAGPEWAPVSKFARANTPAITDRKGVKKPAKSPMETNTAPSNTSEDTPERLAAVTRRTVITDSRKSNSARPGPPWGNMENNRCTDCKSNGLRQMGNPNLSDVFVTLLRDTKFRRQVAVGRSSW